MKFLELHKILQNNIYSVLSRLLHLGTEMDNRRLRRFFHVGDMDFFSFLYNEMKMLWFGFGSNHCVLTAGDSFNIQHWDVLKYASHMMGINWGHLNLFIHIHIANHFDV